MQTAMYIIQTLLALLLIFVVLIQVKGQGTGLFGSSEGGYRSRRGIDKLLFQFTIVLVSVFLVTSIILASGVFA